MFGWFVTSLGVSDVCVSCTALCGGEETVGWRRNFEYKRIIRYFRNGNAELPQYLHGAFHVPADKGCGNKRSIVR